MNKKSPVLPILKITSITYIIFALIWFSIGIFFIILLLLEKPDSMGLIYVFRFISIVIIILSILNIWVGIRIRKGETWAKIISLIFSIISFFSFLGFIYLFLLAQAQSFSFLQNPLLNLVLPPIVQILNIFLIVVIIISFLKK